MLKLVEKRGRVEIWAVSEKWGIDYWVYGITNGGDPVVCPSLSMAREKACQ